MIPQTHKAAGDTWPGYEQSDLPPKPVVWVGLTVAATLLLFGLVLSRWLGHLSSVHGAPFRAVPLTAVEAENPLGEPSDSPRLQLDEVADEARSRQKQQTKLHSYGRSASGAIHIPIEAAVSLILARGLPPRLPQSEEKADK